MDAGIRWSSGLGAEDMPIGTVSFMSLNPYYLVMGLNTSYRNSCGKAVGTRPMYKSHRSGAIVRIIEVEVGHEAPPPLWPSHPSLELSTHFFFWLFYPPIGVSWVSVDG